MKNQLLLLIVAVVFLNCSTSQRDGMRADSLAVSADTTMRQNETNIASTDSATSPSTTEGTDTLFQVLMRQHAMPGELVGVTVITENFLDVSSMRKPRQLVAALVETGEGQYAGIHDLQFATTYAMLVVFEIRDDACVVVDMEDLGASENQGLFIRTTGVEDLQLAQDQYAAVIHAKTSEEGAGDYASRSDEASVYVLLNNKLTNVLAFTVEDYRYSSDEMGSWASITTTGEMAVLEEETGGLFDIGITTNEVKDGYEEPAPESEATESESESEPEPEETEPGTETESGPRMIRYRWNGKQYEEDV